MRSVETLEHGLHYWRRKNHYYHQDLDRLLQFLVPPGKRVLEVGSGTGILLHALKPSYGVGIDHDPDSIARAQTTFPSLIFQVEDAHEPKLEGLDYPFDYILLINTIGSLKDVQAVFEQLQPFCTPHTRLVISYHNPLWEGVLQLASALGERMPLPAANWLSQRDVTNLLALAQFEVVKVGKRMLCPRRVPLLSTVINRVMAPLPLINALCLTEYIVARPYQHLNPEQTSCSVIIPARNEAGNILNCVQTMPQMAHHTEIIFVEGNSTDHTWQEIQRVYELLKDRYTLKILQQDGKGKGDAVRKGFEAATGDILIILDSDLTVRAEDMPKFFQAIASGQCEFANGCRLVYPLDPTTMPPLNRWANRFFAALLSYILGIQIKDSLCGTKAIRRLDYLELAANRHYFGDFDPFGDFDLLLGAVKQNLKVMDIPVRYHPRVYGSSNIQHVKEGLILLRMCWFAAQKFKMF